MKKEDYFRGEKKKSMKEEPGQSELCVGAGGIGGKEKRLKPEH